MLQPDTWKTITAVVGSAAGLFVGAYLTRSWDRNKWLNDNRKEEYRELLTVMTKASVAVIASASRARDGDYKDYANAACTEFHRVVNDRIFVAAELEELKLVSRWDEAVKKLVTVVDRRQRREYSRGGMQIENAQTADIVAVFELEFATLRKSVVERAIKVSPTWSDVMAFVESIQRLADKS